MKKSCGIVYIITSLQQKKDKENLQYVYIIT